MYPVGFEPTISVGEQPQAAHLLSYWVRIPPGAWIFVCCVCRMLSGRGLCDEMITRPEESYRLCCVDVCDLETSRIGAPYIYDISNLRVHLSLLCRFVPTFALCVTSCLQISSISLWHSLPDFRTHRSSLKTRNVLLHCIDNNVLLRDPGIHK
jgi:hypothetical protein